MTSPLCILRSIKSSIMAGARVSGHHYVEQDPEPGQPECVMILKCSVCNEIQISWQTCSMCGEEPNNA